MEKQSKYNKNYFFNSLAENTLLYCANLLSKMEIDFLSKNIKWQYIPDGVIKNNKQLLDKIDWSICIDKSRALRIALSDINNFDTYPLHLYEYEFYELKQALKMDASLLKKLNLVGDIPFSDALDIINSNPEFLNYYTIDTKELSQSELSKLAVSADFKFIDELQIDLSQIKDIDKMNIIKSKDYSFEIMEKCNVFDEEFKNKAYIKDILEHTGNQYINKLQHQLLKPIDWIYLLKLDPSFINYIDIDLFKEGDTFYLIELCMLFPEYLEMINASNKDLISSLGWEKLLTNFQNDQRIIELCVFPKIENSSWVNILDVCPELKSFRY